MALCCDQWDPAHAVTSHMTFSQHVRSVKTDPIPETDSVNSVDSALNKVSLVPPQLALDTAFLTLAFFIPREHSRSNSTCLQQLLVCTAWAACQATSPKFCASSLPVSGLPPVTSGLVGLYMAEDWNGARWSDASGR